MLKVLALAAMGDAMSCIALREITNRKDRKATKRPDGESFFLCLQRRWDYSSEAIFCGWPFQNSTIQTRCGNFFAIGYGAQDLYISSIKLLIQLFMPVPPFLCKLTFSPLGKGCLHGPQMRFRYLGRNRAARAQHESLPSGLFEGPVDFTGNGFHWPMKKGLSVVDSSP